MDETEGIVILRPGGGRLIDLGNFQMVVKASAAETGGAFTLLEADEPPDFGPPMHIHHDAAETFYVLAGEYIIFVRPACPMASALDRCQAASSTSMSRVRWSATSMS
ncbi:MAG: hypothetical protein ACR2I5_07260 [Candidatus Limnocylindria bacterium]